MNKLFARLTAGALAVVSVFALAACGEKKSEDDKSASAETFAPISEAPSVTDEPTSAPTEAPTEARTPAPTPTPVPWPVDESGYIPSDVEVLAPKNGEWSGAIGSEHWCVARVDGKTVLQAWGPDSQIHWQSEVPEEMSRIYVLRVHPTEDGHVKVFGRNEEGDFTVFYYEIDGTFLFVDAVEIVPIATSLDGSRTVRLILSKGNEVIEYMEGSTTYKYCSFRKEDEIKLQRHMSCVYVNEVYHRLEELDWETKELTKKN